MKKSLFLIPLVFFMATVFVQDVNARGKKEVTPGVLQQKKKCKCDRDLKRYCSNCEKFTSDENKGFRCADCKNRIKRVCENCKMRSSKCECSKAGSQKNIFGGVY